jgi:hypothetical protein
MDAARHRTVLADVERQLAELLDESAGGIGVQVTAYRALIWDAKAHVRAATEALKRMEGEP